MKEAPHKGPPTCSRQKNALTLANIICEWFPRHSRLHSTTHKATAYYCIWRLARALMKMSAVHHSTPPPPSSSSNNGLPKISQIDGTKRANNNTLINLGVKIRTNEQFKSQASSTKWLCRSSSRFEATPCQAIVIHHTIRRTITKTKIVLYINIDIVKRDANVKRFSVTSKRRAIHKKPSLSKRTKWGVVNAH